MGAVIFYKDNCLLYEEGRFYSCEGRSLKSFALGALVPARKIVSLSFKLPATLAKEQLDVQVELKLYNEGGLDPNREYAIDYLHYPLEHENSYLIEAYAIAKQDLEESLREPLRRYGFLDVVFPRFIAYEAFYDQPTHSNDLFFYLGEDEAFVAIYQAGRFIGHRNVDSLMQIAKKTGLELSRIKSLLFGKGLKEENYAPEEMATIAALQEIFYKNIEKVVHSINFKRSFFALSRIDKIYLDAQGQTIDGLREYFVSFGLDGELDLQPLRCCDLDPKSSSMAVAAKYVQDFDSLEQKLNLTLFERPKPLLEFEIVRVGIALAATLLVALGAWLWLGSVMQSKEHEIDRLTQQLEHNRQQSKKYVAALERYKKEQRRLQDLIDAQEAKRGEIEDTLRAIPFIQQSKEARQKMMNDAILGLYTYRLSTKTIEQNGTKRMAIDVISARNQRERIAKFMRFMIAKGYPRVSTKEITMQKGLYESLIEVAR